MLKRILIGALVIFSILAVYVGYEFVGLRAELFTVYDVPDSKVIGPSSEQSDLTVVEFLNYGCQYCQKIHEPLMKALKEDGKVRYIPRPVALNDAKGERIIALLYAAAKQGKFEQMHNFIFKNWPIVDEDAFARSAVEIGIDPAVLLKDAGGSDVLASVEENKKYFSAWGLNSTPTFLMGKSAVYRPQNEGVDERVLLEKFAKARSSF